MIGRIVLGGLALLVAGGAYLGWRFARAVDEPARATPAALEVLAAEPGPAAPPGGAGTNTWSAATSAPPGVLEAVPTEAKPRRSSAARVVDAEDRSGPPALEATPASIRTCDRAPRTEEDARALVDELRDDGVKGNAMRALRTIASAPNELVVPALERALRSDDEQQRSLAACALARREGAPQTAVLARALLALLTPEPGGRFHAITARPWIVSVGRANLDERLCAFHAFCAEPALFAAVETEFEARLSSDDPVLRFDAARIVLAQPGARSRAAALDVLALHLADDPLADDAAVAMRLLGEAGERALPAVLAVLPNADEQARRLIGHFLARFDPGHPAARALAPKELARMGFPAGDMLAR